MKSGWDGVGRGALGTTATDWPSTLEDVTCISLDPAEVWVTD